MPTGPRCIFAPAALAVAALLIFGGCATSGRREPLNLSTAKDAVVRYVDSGGYERDLAMVAVRATAWLEERAARRGPSERLAVVFDVDETVLSNYGHMRAIEFGYEPNDWHAWVERAEAPAIASVR